MGDEEGEGFVLLLLPEEHGHGRFMLHAGQEVKLELLCELVKRRDRGWPQSVVPHSSWASKAGRERLTHYGVRSAI